MSGKSGGAERRTAQRVPTHQHVVFSEYRALGPLRMGTAVDRSSGGLRIITSTPEPLGTTIQIELRATSGATEVLMLEGHVVHLTPMEKGQCAMGIRLVPPNLRAMGRAAARERPTIAARARVPEGADPIAAGAPALAGEAPASAGTADEAVTFRRIEDGGRAGSWIALFAILILFVILLLLVLEAIRNEVGPIASGFVDRGWFTGLLAAIGTK